MSALEDYRRFSITITGFKTMHEARVVLDGFDKFRRYTNAAVAELEAKVEHYGDNLEGLQHALVRANQQYTQADHGLQKERERYEACAKRLEEVAADKLRIDELGSDWVRKEDARISNEALTASLEVMTKNAEDNGNAAMQAKAALEVSQDSAADLARIERFARMAVDGDIDESAKGWILLRDALEEAP